MSSFYKMDPAAWDFGTVNLTLEEEAAYLRIVNAIHKHDAPVPNVDRVLAGMFRCSTRKARALLSALEAAGKVVIEDGKIWNERARSDLVQRQLTSSSAQVRGSKGGRTRAENAAKSLENNEQGQATASSRIEENRIEGPVADATGENDAKDPAQIVFHQGLSVLLGAGKKEGAARSILGKWRKLHGDEAVIAALGKAQREGAIDPVAYCEGVFRNKPKREAADQWL